MVHLQGGLPCVLRTPCPLRQSITVMTQSANPAFDGAVVGQAIPTDQGYLELAPGELRAEKLSPAGRAALKAEAAAKLERALRKAVAAMPVFTPYFTYASTAAFVARKSSMRIMMKHPRLCVASKNLHLLRVFQDQ